VWTNTDFKTVVSRQLNNSRVQWRGVLRCLAEGGGGVIAVCTDGRNRWETERADRDMRRRVVGHRSERRKDAGDVKKLQFACGHNCLRRS